MRESGAGVPGDRWGSLFADLESGFEAQRRAELQAEVEDLTIAEWGALRLADRLRAQQGRELELVLTTGRQLAGLVAEVGQDWLGLTQGRALVVVPAGAVQVIWGLNGAALELATAGLARSLPLQVVLRRVVRDRAQVRVHLACGDLTGRLTRVGRDHLDLQPPGPGPALTVQVSAVGALWIWQDLAV